MARPRRPAPAAAGRRRAPGDAGRSRQRHARIPWWTRSWRPARSRRSTRSSSGPTSRAASPRSWSAKARRSRRASRCSKWMTPSSRPRWRAPRPSAIWRGSRSTRTRELLSQKASSQSELERAEATARSTEAEYQLLKVRLDRTTVRAPFSGVVGPPPGEPRGLRDHGHRIDDAPDRLTPARGLSGARAVRRQAEGGAAGHLPGGGPARTSVFGAGGLRGSGGAAPGAHDHGEGAGAQSAPRAPVRHVHRGPPGHRRAPERRRDRRGRGAADPGHQLSCGWRWTERRLAGRWSWGSARRASSKPGPGSRRASRWWSVVRSAWPKVRRSAVTLVDRTPASGRESVGGTTPAADTAGRAPAARDTAASRADSAVAESAEAGASQGR